jgi:sterol desaturase/sphingolipid hydroxylase (fatty acid hydroxylase superfamily)
MKTLEFLLILALFWAIVIWTVVDSKRREKLLSRSQGQWAIDLFGLTFHGIGVSLFQSAVIFVALSWCAPELRGTLEIPGWLAFLISFVGVDYAYYWNHRILHTPVFWRFHSLHHSGNTFDVFTTSRNSAVSTFFILYIWVNGFLIFFLKNPEAYALGVALSNGLDILRHAGSEAWLDIAPINWLISPRDHAWHHSADLYDVNFGGNFNLWDKLHGTYHRSERLPNQIGTPLKATLWDAFWKGAPDV